jgi:hypothetical protein
MTSTPCDFRSKTLTAIDASTTATSTEGTSA